MPLNDTILNIGCAAMQTAMTHAQIHTALPNSSGSNEATVARKPITWVTAANGDMVATVDLVFTGGPANGPATYLGFWSALTGGTSLGRFLKDDATWAAPPMPSTTLAGLNTAITDGDVVANGGGVATIRALTQPAYDALGTPDANTLYVII